MPKKIVIIGFGDTGLLSAIHLPKEYEITAISSKPLLLSGQELGMRLSNTEEWKKEYFMNFNSYPHLDKVTIVHAFAESVDTQNQLVTARSISNENIILEYDALLIASGVSNGFWRNGKLENGDQIENELKQNQDLIKDQPSIDVIGGGASSASVAYNLKKTYPNKVIRLFYPRDLPLPSYPAKTRKTIKHYLDQYGVECFSNHRLETPAKSGILQNQKLTWLGGQESINSTLCLIAIGSSSPNSNFLEKRFLNEESFVNVNQFLQSPIKENVFCVGDIADSDPNRCSARNEGFKVVSHNIHCFLQGNSKAMKSFKAPEQRWGSIIGVQRDEGLRVFTPKGGNVRIPYWLVRKLIFPLFVRKMIYRGVHKKRHEL